MKETSSILSCGSRSVNKVVELMHSAIVRLVVCMDQRKGLLGGVQTARMRAAKVGATSVIE